MSQFGQFQITRGLSRGGMGVVCLTWDSRLDRGVAIKALPPELASNPARLERFGHEAKTRALLNHPNIARIHGVEEYEGARYLFLEFVEGQTLPEMLDRRPLLLEDAIELAVQITSSRDRPPIGRPRLWRLSARRSTMRLHPGLKGDQGELPLQEQLQEVWLRESTDTAHIGTRDQRQGD